MTHWERVEEIFHLALEQPAAGRDAFLREQCAGESQLEHDVRRVLDGYEADERTREEGARGSQPVPGARYGAFEIVRKIGEGGMGAVYLGRRSEDFEQRAAIKLVSGGPFADVILSERFRQERRILAALEHPNIARVLDGGVSASGEAYLVMEYVEGVRLDEYCSTNSLPLAARLNLFRKICAAVHYAHQRLIIHRDLKPSNILVGADGDPKLLDFGIAKALTEADGVPNPSSTMTSRLMLTPSHASPEQIKGQACTVTSDIYSLGVILYELLAGKSPYQKTGSTPELVAEVVASEPVRPSVNGPAALRAALRGDLDGIVMKAMAKNPADRYSSVEQFSEDIRRQLEGLPVSAVEGTRWYLARKFVKRYSWAVMSAALLVLTLVAGLTATLWQARRAEQQFSDARQLANYLLFQLFDSVQTLPGSLPVRAAMAKESLVYLDRMNAERVSDRALRLELAEGYVRLASILQAPVDVGDSLGEIAGSIDSARKALAILEPLIRERPNDARVLTDLAHADTVLGNALSMHEERTEGVARLKEATKILDRVMAMAPRDADRLVDAGRAYFALMGIVSGGGGMFRSDTKDETMEAGGRAIERLESALAISPEQNTALTQLAGVYLVEGDVIAPVDPLPAIEIMKKGLAAFNRLPPSVRSLPALRKREGELYMGLAWAQQQAGQYRVALETIEPAQRIMEKLAEEDPQNAVLVRRVAGVYDIEADCHQGLHNLDAAIDDYRHVLAAWDQQIALDSSKPSNFMIRASTQGEMAEVLAMSGRAAEAAAYAKAGIDYLTGAADRPNASPAYLDEAATMLVSTPVVSLRDYPRGLAYAQRADQLSGGKDFTAVICLAQAYANLGKATDAMEAVQRGLILVPAAAPGASPSEPRKTLEKQQRGIETLMRTGRLPRDFNDSSR